MADTEEASVSPKESKNIPALGSKKYVLVALAFGALVFVCLVLSLEGECIDKHFEALGVFKSGWMAAAIITVAYFVGGRVVAKHAKKWRKEAKVPRMNQVIVVGREWGIASLN